LGSTPDYDQEGYDEYISMVQGVRISMAVIVGIIAVTLMGIGIYLADPLGAGLIFVAIALVLLIIVPVYTAL
jgi:hypothetical protein